MSTESGLVGSYSLVAITARFGDLQDELSRLQGDYRTLHASHQEQCSASLRNALKSLFRVIVYVKKVDKSLIDWHHRSRALKLALRVVGLDRRTQTLINKKTKKLKTKVSDVEGNFQDTNEIFDCSIAVAGALNADFANFSQLSVDEVFAETALTLAEYDNAQKAVETNIEKQNAQRLDLRLEANSTATAAQELQQQQEQSESARRGFLGSSVFSFGAAAIGIALCPPTAVVAPLLLGGVVGVGVLAGGAACVATGEIRSLEARQIELNKSMTHQESIIRELEAKLAGLNSDRKTCADAITVARSLQTQTRALHREAQLGLDHIRCAQLVLNTMHTKLEQIIDRLNQCSYAETRRDIAGNLRQILDLIMGTLHDKLYVFGEGDVSRAIVELAEIDQKTYEVVTIANIALPPSSRTATLSIE